MKRCVIAVVATVFLLAAFPAEAGFRRATGNKPLKGRYIITLKNSVTADQVDTAADALARLHGGRLLGTMKHAMRGFGIALPENVARVLAEHPLVEMVEEDELFELASEAPFDFETAARPLRAVSTRTIPVRGIPAGTICVTMAVTIHTGISTAWTIAV